MSATENLLYPKGLSDFTSVGVILYNCYISIWVNIRLKIIMSKMTVVSSVTDTGKTGQLHVDQWVRWHSHTIHKTKLKVA